MAKTAKKKEQKRQRARPGAHSLTFRGKTVTYNNPVNLAKKLNISYTHAKQLITKEDTGRRLVIQGDSILAVNVHDANVGLLLKKFGIERISNEKLLTENVVLPAKEVEIVKRISHEQSFNHHIDIDVIIGVYGYEAPQFKRRVKSDPPAARSFVLIDNNEIVNIRDAIAHGESRSWVRLDNTKIYRRDPQISLDFQAIVQNSLNCVQRDTMLVYTGTLDEIEREIFIQSHDYAARFPTHARAIMYTYTPYDMDWKTRLKGYGEGYVGNELLGIEGYTNLCCEQLDKDTKLIESGQNSCVLNFVAQKYPKKKIYWKMKKLQEQSGGIGIRYIDMITLFNKKEIPYRIYNISNKIINESLFGVDPISPTILAGMLYNDHIYPINGAYLVKTRKKPLKIKLVDDGAEALREYISTKKKIPYNIKIGKLSVEKKKVADITSVDVLSFCGSGTTYICNPQYETCLEVLKKLGYEKYIKPSITLLELPKLIQKIMGAHKAESFIPNKALFRKPPFIFKQKNEKNPHNKKLVKEDKNKAYIWGLYNLPYLICFDWRKDDVTLVDNDCDIIASNLYKIIPTDHSLIYPCTHYYAGYHVNYARSIGLEFKIVEELHTRIVDNYYRNIIKTLYTTLNNNDFKTVSVILCGLMEREITLKQDLSYDSVQTAESADYEEGNCRDIGDGLSLFIKTKDRYTSSRDQMPVNWQMKDMCRVIMHQHMRYNNIADSDVVYMNTDSIIYYADDAKYNEYITALSTKYGDYEFHDYDDGIYHPRNIAGWKYEKISENDMHAISLTEIDSLPIDKPRLSLMDLNGKHAGLIHILHMKNAGAGKTTHIIDTIQHGLLGKMSYIILGQHHKTLEEYRNRGLNCNTISSYRNTIPKEDYIFIDEIGIVDTCGHDLLYRLHRLDKHYECFGDFNQQLPVGEKVPINQPRWLNFLFDKIYSASTNYRNAFSFEYYTELQTVQEKDWLIEEVKKHGTKKYYDAEVIICVRCATRDLYNAAMLKRLKLKPYDVGVKLVCITNKFYDSKKSIGVYNQQRFIISRVNGDKITLQDDKGVSTNCSLKDVKKNFRHGYAYTTYGIQGATLQSYYWAEEDDFFVTNKIAYTVISRLMRPPRKFSQYSLCELNAMALDILSKSDACEYICNKIDYHYKLDELIDQLNDPNASSSRDHTKIHTLYDNKVTCLQGKFTLDYDDL